MEQDENKTRIQEHAATPDEITVNRLLRTLISIKDTGNTVEDVTETINHIQDTYKDMGLFVSLPSVALLPKSEAVFNKMINSIRAELSNNGVSGETVEAVTQDYGKAITGDYLYKATPVQMLEVLKKIKPYKAYLIDKYGLYFGVMMQYQRCLAMVGKFNDAFRSASATADTKTEFMDGEYSALEAVALMYLFDRRFFTLKDFDGIEREQVITWLDGLESWANVGKYALYYTIAKLELGATPEELNTIAAPPHPRAKEFAPAYCENVEHKINELYGKVVELVEADTPQEREQVKQEVEAWDSKTNAAEVIRVPQNFAIIQSRPLYGATDGEQAKDILPISAFIEYYLKGKNISLSPIIAERAIQGVNLLQRFYKVKPENGKYVFNTNISKFAEACGYADANDEQKKQLLAALLVLNDMYVVVWKPKGRAAIKVITVQEIGLSGDVKGDLKIEVTAEAMKGRPTLITYGDIQKLQKAAKGAAQHHFNGQILSKSHKREDDLLNEVFGYDEKIDEAKRNNATEQDIKDIRTYIRKKKPSHKKQLLKMFEKAQADGIIVFERYENSKGETVYKWERVNVPDEAQEPEEQ
mgnify:CR=1 FL=1